MSKRARQDEQDRQGIRAYYASGDEQLLAPVFTSFRRLLAGYIRGRLGIYDHVLVDELSSTVITRVLKQFRSKEIDAEANLWAWVCLAARFALNEHVGGIATTPSHPGMSEDPFLLVADELVSEADGLPENAEDERRAADTLALATQAMLALDPNARACIHLHYYKSLPVAVAAKQLGISEATFNSRLFRGMQGLRAWAQENPGLALSGEQYAALPRVNTGKLFDDNDLPPLHERRRQADKEQNERQRERLVKLAGGEEEYKRQRAAKSREWRLAKKAAPNG